MNITTLVDWHLGNYLTYTGLDPEIFDRLQRQIAEEQDLQDRKNMDGHVTSSFLLLDPSLTKVLMIHHKGFDKWLCPGGHYEGNVTPRKSALRELTEETGYPADKVAYFDHMGYLPLDVDTHEIPARPDKGEGDHWHHDFLYLGVPLPDEELTHQEEEVHGVKWISIRDAMDLPDTRVRRLMDKVTKVLQQSK